MGYKSNEKDEFGQYVSNEEVERWNDKDFRWNGDTKVYPDWETPNGTYHYTPYGVFDGLPEMGIPSLYSNHMKLVNLQTSISPTTGENVAWQRMFIWSSISLSRLSRRQLMRKPASL